MTRTDRLAAAITAELEARRREIDRGEPLTSVSVVVFLDAAGLPLYLVWRAENKRQLRGMARTSVLGA